MFSSALSSFLNSFIVLWKTKWLFWVSHSPDFQFNLQPLFTHPNLFDSEADYCHVTRTSECQKPGNEGLFFSRSKMDFIHMCYNIYRFCCCWFYIKATKGISLILLVYPFSVGFDWGLRGHHTTIKDNKLEL